MEILQTGDGVLQCNALMTFTLGISLFVVFCLMGRNYDAAVVTAGFGGYALGATPGRNGQHVGGHHSLRRFASGLYHRATGRGLLHRPGQCADDPVFPFNIPGIGMNLQTGL